MKTKLNSKVAAIMGAALAAISGIHSTANASTNETTSSNESNSFEYKAQKRKPMPVMKLNMQNPEDSRFIANHNSHSSHRSHYSHYSHRSGAMFN